MDHARKVLQNSLGVPQIIDQIREDDHVEALVQSKRLCIALQVVQLGVPDLGPAEHFQ